MNSYPDKINIYCIPGLGINTLLFKNLDLPAFNIIPVNWESPRVKETLPHYAMRLAEQIDTSKPFVLLGVSFGGMCAMEIAKQIGPVKTILLSSSKVHTELPDLLKILSLLPAHHVLSDSLYLNYTWLIKRRLGVTKAMESEFRSMLTLPPENYFARAIDMIIHWKNETIPANVIHIHGNADKVIPYQKKITYTHTIEKGSHLMVVDRAEEINRILNQELDRLR